MHTNRSHSELEKLEHGRCSNQPETRGLSTNACAPIASTFLHLDLRGDTILSSPLWHLIRVTMGLLLRARRADALSELSDADTGATPSHVSTAALLAL